jgi:hypothetical protein
VVGDPSGRIGTHPRQHVENAAVIVRKLPVKDRLVMRNPVAQQSELIQWLVHSLPGEFRIRKGFVQHGPP